MNNTLINISFVIPVYNSEKTIEETVDSIFSSNFKDGDEVLLVEDCSTDNTLKIIKKLEEKYYPHIKIIRNIENKGCPTSRNIGISQTKNEYIFSFDSDNVFAENSVNLLRKKIIDTKADIITFGEVHFFEKNIKKITHKWIFKKGWLNLEDLFAGNFNPGPIGNYLFIKASWEKVGGFSELEKGLHEAWIFTFKQLISGSKFYIHDKGFYFHRYGHESLTIREYKKDLVERKILETALSNHMNIFIENDKEYVKQNTPLWIHMLNKRPINLINSNKGKNGKIHRTVYGIYCSILKRLK